MPGQLLAALTTRAFASSPRQRQKWDGTSSPNALARSSNGRVHSVRGRRHRRA
jgi:hypothetical protein